MALWWGHCSKAVRAGASGLSRGVVTCSYKNQKVMENLHDNPYYVKYKHKIAQLQKTSPEEFVQRIEKKSKHEGQEPYTKRYESLAKPKEALGRDVPRPKKSLADIFKMELVEEKSKEEIEDIWLGYHVQKDVLAAAIPLESYNNIKDRMKLFPAFLFPLPRAQGYEYFVSQVSGDEVHITTLLCYQVHKENAPECLTLVHYNELADKGIVLMRGEYDTNVIDSMAAQCLVNQFQMYYGQEHPTKLALLESFTSHPDCFKHTDLISELENMELKLAKT